MPQMAYRLLSLNYPIGRIVPILPQLDCHLPHQEERGRELPPEFVQSSVLDLAHPLACNPHLLADLIECLVVVAVGELLLISWQTIHQPAHLALQEKGRQPSAGALRLVVIEVRGSMNQ